jgi:RHS repeat-associated protein
MVVVYDYDSLNRLTAAYYSNDTHYSYTYDAVGNRPLQTIDGQTTSYQYDNANWLTSVGGISYTWDNNGNLLSDGVYTYTYDYDNRLTSANDGIDSFSFAYNALGDRYQQTANGATVTYTLDIASDLSQVLMDGNNTYLYGLGRIAQENESRTDYFLPDALGSVRQLTTQDGYVGLTQSFDPFGNPFSTMGPSASSYGYTGEWVDDTGLQYLHARYYTPIQSRFLTRDPFAGFLVQPATLNPYLYVLNNPVFMTDPSGEIAPILILAALGFVGGALLNTWQQTNGFTNWCHFDVMQALAWGIGGAAAVSWFAIISVGAVGMAGFGLQGIAMGLNALGIGIMMPFATSLWLGGIAALDWTATASMWLWTGNNYPTLEIDSSKIPNIAKNINNAQANGAPQVLTRTQNQALIAANRYAACKGFCGIGSPDEYPFASTYEGGTGSSVSGVTIEEQWAQGEIVSRFYLDYNILDRSKFRVIVK